MGNLDPLPLYVIYLLWHDITQAYIFRYSFQEERRQLTRQVAIQQSHYLSLTEKIDETIRMRHDQRHHMQLLRSCLWSIQQYEQMKEYLQRNMRIPMNWERTYGSVPKSCNRRYFTILSWSLSEAADQVRCGCTASLLICQSPTLTCLFCLVIYWKMHMMPAKRLLPPLLYIQIKAGWQNEKLYFRIENSYKIWIHKHQDKYLSTKHEGYGVGTESVKALTERYHGQIKLM